MKRLKLCWVLLLVLAAPHGSLLATAKNTSLSDFNPLEMYETVKGGAWRHLNPKEIKPDGIKYTAGKTGVTSYVDLAPCTEDEAIRYEATQRATQADFMYQLALLPTLVNYCLEHALDDEFLGIALPSSAIDGFFSEEKFEIPAHSYHFIHHTIGTSARFDFFKELMPLDFLDTSSWKRLGTMVSHIEKSHGSRSVDFPSDREYFAGDQFIIDMRQGVLELMANYKIGDLLIGVGNTPQIPLRALSSIVPFIKPTILPLSGWPGRHKLSNSWIDNVITPRALYHIDTHLKGLLGTDEAHLPARLLFVDMVINGFGISLLIDRIDQLCHDNGWKTPPHHILSLIDFTNTYTQEVVFGGKITLAKSSRLAIALDSDDIGRYVPSAPMRVWDASIPLVGKPDDGLDSILRKVDENFRNMTL